MSATNSIRVQAGRGSPPRCAAPSWAIPGSVADNARFLAGKVSEVGLCFFETEACLAYGADDLPPDLGNLPLSWHVHLPLDLPWAAGGGAAASAALRLMDKVGFLDCRRAVLHLPEGLAVGPDAPARDLRVFGDFVACWRASGRASRDILLENQPGDAPGALLSLAKEYDAGLCLDFSHWLLTHGPELFPEPEFLRRVSLLHLNAPGVTGGGHGGLDELSPAQRAWAAQTLQAALARRKPPAVSSSLPLLMLEIFSWDKILKSLPLLDSWLF